MKSIGHECSHSSPCAFLARRLAPCVKAFNLPKEAFLEMIRGCEMDLRAHRYETFADFIAFVARLQSETDAAFADEDAESPAQKKPWWKLW